MKIRTAIPASTGGILLFFGVIMFFTAYFVITLSKNSDLMLQIIKITDLSFGIVFMAYIQLPIAIGFIICGVYVMIFSDNKAELPTQKIHPDLIKKEFREMGKIPLNKRLAWIFLGIEFTLAGILFLIGREIIPSSRLDIPIIISIFVFLILGIILDRTNKTGTKRGTIAAISNKP